MTYRELILEGERILSPDEDAKVDAMLLLQKAAGLSRASYLVKQREEAKEEEVILFRQLLDRRKEREPIAYILREWEFMGLPFAVNENVLIPRQDTETLVENALMKAEEYIGKNRPETFRILDMCTGSGCIAVSLAYYLKKRFPEVKVETKAADLSGEALKTAKANAKRNRVEIEFIRSDMFENIPAGMKFHMIVSNPPYIDDAQMKTLQKDVREYEPEMALSGGADGLDFYRVLADKSALHLEDRGMLFLEIGDEQRESVKALIEAKEELSYIRCIRDYGDNDRVIEAERR